MHKVYLLLGSNRGDREQNLLKACSGIAKTAGEIKQLSSVYETSPWGFEDDTSFYNQAVELETELEPHALLNELHRVEASLGRIRFESCGSACGCSSSGYSSRTIDIDILFYGSRILFTDELMIPHPRLHERRFTLVPLNEIAAELQHPVYRKTISELLNACSDTGEVNKATL